MYPAGTEPKYNVVFTLPIGSQ